MTQTFHSPLLTSLIPLIAADPSFTFSRNVGTYVPDHEGLLQNVNPNEARFRGARRVRNVVTANTTNMSASIVKTNCTVTFGVLGPKGLNDGNTVTATAALALAYRSDTMGALNYRSSLWVRRRTGTGTVAFKNMDNSRAVITSAIADGLWHRFCSPVTAGQSAAKYIGVEVDVSGDAVDIAYAQIEVVSGQSNQAPGDYVSRAYLAAPYHGTGIDGCKCFDTTNNNTVTGNIVNEIAGTPISAAVLLGLLLEDASTNICRRSHEFDILWTKTNCTVAANNQMAPDGSQAGDTVTDNATNGSHLITVPSTGGTLFSIYAKAGTLSWIQLACTGVAATTRANFNISTGAIGYVDPAAYATITPLANGWFRCAVKANPTNTDVAVYLSNADVSGAFPSYAGGTGTVILWGSMLEDARGSAYPSGYVLTANVTVNRPREDFDYQVLNNVGAAAGTAYAEFYFVGVMPGSIRSLYRWMANTTAPLYVEGSTQKMQYSDGSNIVVGPDAIYNTYTKAASAWGSGTASLCQNGGTVYNSAAAPFPNSGALRIGNSNTPADGVQGYIRNLRLFNNKLSDAELQALPTLPVPASTIATFNGVVMATEVKTVNEVLAASVGGVIGAPN